MISQEVRAAFRSYGFVVNFTKGKTEVMVNL